MKEEIESAITMEAAFYAAAALEINPYSEAEVLEIGSARAIYTGTISSIHGVYGLGLDGPIEEKDFQEIERFYQRKERAPQFWISSFADSSVLEYLGKYRVTKTHAVCAQLTNDTKTQEDAGSNTPDLKEWTNAFTKVEGALAATTRLHQKNIRFYLREDEASFTFFHNGIALIPFLQKNLFSKQLNDAKKFHSKIIAHFGDGPLPVLYERKLYERI